MQILHPFQGSIQEYCQELISHPERYRPERCPQCQREHPLQAHGFYSRTLVAEAFDGVIRIRRYLCPSCKRTVSLLPAFALPYLRFSLSVIGLFLLTRLLEGRTLPGAAEAASLPGLCYRRGQFWIRRFRAQAEQLCVDLVALTTAPAAESFVHRALQMLKATGWISAHRYLFSKLRVHLLGWPKFLHPAGLRVTLPPAAPAG
jgi:hypothetical protein